MVLPGDRVRFAPRWARHTWERCPFALIGWGDSQMRGAAAALDLCIWTRDGAPLRDIEPSPTAVAFEAVSMLRRELSKRQAAEMEDG